jgi:hypothetical protein
MMKITYGLTVIALMILASSCGPKEQTQQETASHDTDSTVTNTSTLTTDNQITEQQKTEGWKALFDGKSLSGWHFYKGASNDSWEVVNGTLHCRPFNESGENKRADLTTDEDFENFELTFDWKITPQANSGVMFHVNEQLDQPYASGPEYQILDDEGYPGDVPPVQLTGANYGMQQTSTKKMNPIGEWNSSKLVVQQQHVEHWLNGDKILEYNLGSDEWKKLKASSKWKDFPGYGMTSKGHIDLQDHGNEVWFKNIYIKTL